MHYVLHVIHPRIDDAEIEATEVVKLPVVKYDWVPKDV